MEIVITHEEGKVPVAVLHLRGDLAAEEPLKSSAAEAFEAGARNMLLDLSEVPFISSAGLRAIHAIYMMLRSADPAEAEAATKGIARGTYKSPHLKLLKPSKNAMKSLSVAGYDMFLEIHSNLKEAVASFG